MCKLCKQVQNLYAMCVRRFAPLRARVASQACLKAAPRGRTAKPLPHTARPCIDMMHDRHSRGCFETACYRMQASVRDSVRSQGLPASAEPTGEMLAFKCSSEHKSHNNSHPFAV